ncbi:DNA-directed RNA polymerase subunit omega [Athalassotoga saccharophila]|uniref:DNA-directed RNA polymerase subunit omega n=1 Tax=Athalassotoga saccharophila TaxID=1441386 RepID=UPI00137B9359|nr:DNA-directed RNA polymerase subunit omega [Athalassotoga saccharophila]BBJ27618.1 DNA-directed RNA polymerase subunit omega [Athalassotoga saccharophila]
MKDGIYETLMNRYGNKYAISMAVAKRAESLNELSKPLVKTEESNLVTIALQEMAAGYVEIKNSEMLKALTANVKISKKR